MCVYYAPMLFRVQSIIVKAKGKVWSKIILKFMLNPGNIVMIPP